MTTRGLPPGGVTMHMKSLRPAAGLLAALALLAMNSAGYALWRAVLAPVLAADSARTAVAPGR